MVCQESSGSMDIKLRFRLRHIPRGASKIDIKFIGYLFRTTN